MEKHTIFWTFQRKEIFNKLRTDGKLIPDFQTLVSTDKEYMLPAYYYILHDYNQRNFSAHKGLIFGHVGGDAVSILDTVDDLYRLLDINGYPGGTYFDQETHVLLKLLIPSNIDILKIDFYRFSDLIFTFSEGEPDDIKNRVIEGLYNPNGPNGTWELIQGHIPFIDNNWIIGVFTPRDIQ